MVDLLCPEAPFDFVIQVSFKKSNESEFVLTEKKVRKTYLVPLIFPKIHLNALTLTVFNQKEVIGQRRIK